jgi:hypothetical protein
MTPIALLDDNDQLMEIELDGRTYYLGVSWNEEAGRWTTSLRDLDRDLLVSSIALLPLYPLLRQVRTAEMPPGEMIVHCSPGTVLDRRAFFDGRASLWYVSADTLAELAAQG